MKCPACNSEITALNDSCAHCGAPAYLAVATQSSAYEHCTYCGTREEANLPRCSNCGLKRGFKLQEVPVGNCSNCGSSWRDAWQHCRTCGIMRKQGLIEVMAPFSVSTQALRNYPVTTASNPVSPRQDRFVESAFTLVQPRQEEQFKESSFSSDEFQVRDDDPVFSAPMMSENEVVGRMFANDGGDDEYENNFVQTQRKPEPSIVVYDLQQEKTHEVITERTAPSRRVASPPPPPVVEERIPLTVAPPIVAPVILAPPVVKPIEVAVAPPAQVAQVAQVENKPVVQAVKLSKKARGGTPPPIDTFLVKLIAALIGSILLFAGLIVSGYKIRDVFSKPKPGTAVKAIAPATTATQPRQLSEPSHTPPGVDGMVSIPGGDFMMGEDNDPSTEMASPAHKVTVQPFFMDRTEVTNSAYAAFVKATKYPAPTGWTNNNFPKGMENFPVVNVSWDDANAFAKWAGKRLPTEAEWEFAARSNDGRFYPWGMKWLDNVSNTQENSKNKLAEVGSFIAGASPFGVLDMAGNVWEWTLSDVQSYRDPNTNIGSGKVIRGGAFSLRQDRAKATYRGYNQPEAKTEALGFRLVKDAS
jgi:gamma-glutamyl hercynylcysteine S-oxide synthase